jgi:divalent metal cation (Fe/Co/Zn/Cd) transporter
MNGSPIPSSRCRLGRRHHLFCRHLSTAWVACSPAPLAFGSDNTVELLSAVVVLWRFRSHDGPERAERRASRIAGALLFVLAVYVVAASALTLLGYSEPTPTYLGIVILLAAAAGMPFLAKEKRKLSVATASAALRADAAESALCAHLSIIALVGLGINAIWHAAWADAVAALVLTPLILWEGRESIRGKACASC